MTVIYIATIPNGIIALLSNTVVVLNTQRLPTPLPMSSPMRKGELDLGLHLSCGEIHAEEAPTRGVERKGVAQQASSPWWLNSSSTMIGNCVQHSLIYS
jgi:hypothetical protein